MIFSYEEKYLVMLFQQDNMVLTSVLTAGTKVDLGGGFRGVPPLLRKILDLPLGHSHHIQSLHQCTYQTFSTFILTNYYNFSAMMTMIWRPSMKQQVNLKSWYLSDLI